MSLLSKVPIYYKVLFIITLGVICALYFMDVPPIPQRMSYHNFADDRQIWGIPNFWNVISNLPIIIFSLMGLIYLASKRSNEHFIHDNEKLLYFLFFTMTLIAGFCSAYYHWDPDNARILWDRLPLVLAFPCLFAILIGERINLKAGFYFLIPLMLIGLALILYWYYSEFDFFGGDLRPYYFGEWFILLALPMTLILFNKSPYTENKYLWLALILFATGRIIEKFDLKIYLFLDQTLSGHTIKHLLAGLSILFMVLYIWKRQSFYVMEETEIEASSG